MALAIKEENGDKHLITAHTQGGRALVDMLSNPAYLDFITWQSGHMGESYPSWRAIEKDYARLNKPVLDAEPCYECHPIMQEYSFVRQNGITRFTDYNVRRSAYWSVFSGGAGITYGCYSIWQMRRKEDDSKEIPESAASAYKSDHIPYYQQALNYPGAFQIPYLKSFIESLPNNTTLCPDNSLILSENPQDERHMCALTNATKDFIAVYVPTSQRLCLDISGFGYKGYSIYCYDPRYNIYNHLSDDCSESMFLSISTPRDNLDYVILLKRKNL